MKTFLSTIQSYVKDHMQIPMKDQSYVKVGRNDVHYIRVLKLWVN